MTSHTGDVTPRLVEQVALAEHPTQARPAKGIRHAKLTAAERMTSA